MTKNQNQTDSNLTPVVTGTVLSPDAVVFARPKTKAELQTAVDTNRTAIRNAVETLETTTAGMLPRLILALVLTPESSTDSNGKITDALSALTSGKDAVRVPRPEVSKARAGALLIGKAGISSTDDPRWSAVAQIVGRAGVGADRVSAFLNGRGQQRVLAALEAVGEAKGKAKDEAIRGYFPKTDTGSTPPADGEHERSDFERMANDACEALRAAHVALVTFSGAVAPEGMSDERADAIRATVATALAVLNTVGEDA